MVAKTTASVIQKENFKSKFAEIVKNNAGLREGYSIQFFETAQKTNYSFTARNGKSLNILTSLTLEETEKYKVLKSSWQN